MADKKVAFVPIRSGSKEIKDKNIKELYGKPLIYWVLQALEKSWIDKIVVAIDSEKYKEIIKQFNFNKVVFYDRDEKNAQDASSTESVILEYLGNKGYEEDYDTFLLVQATSPLLTYKDINGIIQVYEKGIANSFLSVADITGRFLWEDKYIGSRTEAVPINYDYTNRLPRQYLSNNIYMENGAMYINNVDNIVKSKCRLTAPVGLYVMSYWSMLEVDSLLDWEMIELLMRHFK